MTFLSRWGIITEEEEKKVLSGSGDDRIDFDLGRVISKLKEINTMPKAISKKPKALFDAPEDRRFYVHEGASVHNLAELRNVLETMSEGQYAHHTADGRNDFAAWIDGVFGESALAKRVEKAATRDKVAKVLERYLA